VLAARRWQDPTQWRLAYGMCMAAGSNVPGRLLCSNVGWAQIQECLDADICDALQQVLSGLVSSDEGHSDDVLEVLLSYLVAPKSLEAPAACQ
jgi:hypothetical protein